MGLRKSRCDLYFPALAHRGSREYSSVFCRLWMTEASEALNPCACDRALHTWSAALHRPFEFSCGIRGKRGQEQRCESLVFQIRRIAQLRFRKPDTITSSAHTSTLRSFPLFLVERRILLSFYLFIHTFPTTRRAPRAHTKPIGAFRSALFSPSLAAPIGLDLGSPYNPEKRTVFPRTRRPLW